MRSLIVATGLAAGLLFTTSTASAQFVVGGRVPGGGFQSVEQMPGRYFGFPGGTNINPYTGSVYRPWAGTVYQNPWSGNQYNPGSGAYVRRWGW
jgi:hypothetical protein